MVFYKLNVNYDESIIIYLNYLLTFAVATEISVTWKKLRVKENDEEHDDGRGLTVGIIELDEWRWR